MSVSPLASLRNGLSPSRFVRDFQLPRRPGHFQGLLTTHPAQDKVVWPALKKWSKLNPDGQETLDGLKRPEIMDLIVPVEVSQRGVGYNAGGGKWDRLELPFCKSSFLPLRKLQSLARWRTPD